MTERNFLFEFQSHHNHPRHPEENNVITCYQHACRIELPQFHRVFRPAHSRKGPQGGAKPSIQHVRILLDSAAAMRTCRQIIPRNNGFATAFAVPSGNAMTPPNLPGNTPVANIFQPVQIRAAETLRHKLHPPVPHYFHRRFRQGLHFHKPLFRHQRLHNSAAALTMPYCMRMTFHFDQNAHLLEIRQEGLTALVTILPGIFTGFFGHIAFRANDNNLLQIVPLSHFKVIRIMGRCNFHGTSTESRIYIVIR